MIIAEIGTSHEGSRQKALELIHAAAEAGADAVKFQWVYADEILHPNTGFVSLPTGKIPLYERFKQLEAGPAFFSAMQEEARRLGMAFVCSPFGTRSLKELHELKPDYIKIASPELNHYPLLHELKNLNDGSHAEERIPVILSSGVSSLADIEKALAVTGTCNVTLLHCVTSYPAPPQEYNLRLIRNLAAITGTECGVSDHSLDPVLVPALSIAMGATMIEKHITLSRQTQGLDDPVALEPEQFAQMVLAVRQAQAAVRHFSNGSKTPSLQAQQYIITQMQAQYGEELVQRTLGSGVKHLAQSERANYGRTNRSLHYMRPLIAGTRVSAADIAVLRTEKELSVGISPQYMQTIIGKRICRNVQDGAGVQWEDFLAE